MFVKLFATFCLHLSHHSQNTTHTHTSMQHMHACNQRIAHCWHHIIGPGFHITAIHMGESLWLISLSLIWKIYFGSSRFHSCGRVTMAHLAVYPTTLRNMLCTSRSHSLILWWYASTCSNIDNQAKQQACGELTWQNLWEQRHIVLPPITTILHKLNQIAS